MPPRLAPHQVEAVARAVELLEQYGGVLLADDVGLGKSFVAAEVARRSDRAIELVVPAALVLQWRETLQEFGVEAAVLTHDELLSQPFVPAAGHRLVIVDEAHAFRNPSTRRYAALARRTAGARVMLVTATPLCNALGDLEALVRLIARDDLLASAGVPSVDVAFQSREREAIGAVLARLMIRRDRGELEPALAFGELERRVIRHPVLHAPEIDGLAFPLTGEPALLRRFLRRRLESSEAALIESVRRQMRFYDRALAAIASGRTLPKRDYLRAFAHEADGGSFQGVLFWELFAPAGECDPLVIRNEQHLLEALLARAETSPCRKRAMLVELVERRDAPMLIFTGSVSTARDLQSVLGCGLVTSRERNRDAVLSAFRRGRIDVLVSTDMAAEGLNLQRAGIVVHYDIPWNPVKLDQRNGRAFRIGQTRASVRAVYFLPVSRETGILGTVARKNRLRRRMISGDLPSGALPASTPTLRPRLTREAAIARLLPRLAALPPLLGRRHKAGVEQVIGEMSREYLDERRLKDLLALVEAEV